MISFTNTMAFIWVCLAILALFLGSDIWVVGALIISNVFACCGFIETKIGEMK